MVSASWQRVSAPNVWVKQFLGTKTCSCKKKLPHSFNTFGFQWRLAFSRNKPLLEFSEISERLRLSANCDCRTEAYTTGGMHKLLQNWPTWGSRYCGTLRARRSRDLIPVGEKFSVPVQTCREAHTVSCKKGIGFSFPGEKLSGRGVDRPPPSSAEVKERLGYTSIPRMDLKGLSEEELYLWLCQTFCMV